jgi:hypothetical protein
MNRSAVEPASMPAAVGPIIKKTAGTAAGETG